MDYIDVKKYRILMCLSQNQFAKQIGITQGTLAKIEGNLIKSEKYHNKIKDVVINWKVKRILELNKQIDFINNL